MKKNLLPLAALIFIASACDTTPKFTIDGTIDGQQAGNVFLIQEKNQALDTISRSAVNNGKFTLSGQVDSITEAFVVIEGKENFSLIFVENAKYTAALNAENPIENKITGSKNQEIFNQFITISAERQKEMMQMSQDYQAAMEAKDAEKISEIEKRSNELYTTTSAQEDALVKANPDSYVSAFIIALKVKRLEYDELKSLYDGLTPAVQASVPGKNIAEYLQMLAPTANGQIAPDFTLNTPAGQPLSMHSIKGKVKIIDFWASWCAPCREVNPEMVEIYKEFKPKGLEILGVSLDNDKDAWTQAIKDDKLTWLQVSDLQGSAELTKQYAVTGIPHTLILDENNVIVAKNLKGEKLKEKIAELLK